MYIYISTSVVDLVLFHVKVRGVPTKGGLVSVIGVRNRWTGEWRLEIAVIKKVEKLKYTSLTIVCIGKQRLQKESGIQVL